MVSAYDRTGMRAARQRIVLKALAAASPQQERDDDEGPRTLRSQAVAAVLAATKDDGSSGAER